MGLRRTGRPNLSCETKFSGANADREDLFSLCPADHKKDWQPHPAGPQFTERHCHIHTQKHDYRDDYRVVTYRK